MKKAYEMSFPKKYGTRSKMMNDVIKQQNDKNEKYYEACVNNKKFPVS